MDDYNREQLQQNISRINAVSGSYSGNAISKLDGTTLGAVNLQFQAKTDVQSSTSTSTSNKQAVNVSGVLTFRGMTAAEVTFDNGNYDDVTGDLVVNIPVAQDGGSTANISLTGHISGDQWIGTLQVKGQLDYGADLNLSKNAPVSNTSKLEVGGTRLDQIKQTNLNYSGTYQIGSDIVPVKMSFINRDILPEQYLYKMFSAIRQVNVVFDFTDFELNFTNAILDDKLGTLIGHDPVDQKGSPVRATLNCQKFDTGKNVFGYDCQVQTKATVLNIHLSAK